MNKKKQHYVWESYLKAWAENNQIFFLSQGSIRHTNLNNIANKRYFYRIKELTLPEIEFIELLTNPYARPSTKRVNRGWAEISSYAFTIANSMERQGHDKEKVAEFRKWAENNVHEELHAQIEAGAAFYLKALQEKDLSFYSDDKHKISFLFFLCLQYFRTQNMKSRVLKNCSNPMGFSTERLWPYLSLSIATNLAVSLAADRKFSPHLLENYAELPFVTGDQPAINLYTANTQSGAQVEDVELYYPISPSTSLLLTANKPSQTSLDYEAALNLNRQIFAQSHSQVYASSRHALEPLQG